MRQWRKSMAVKLERLQLDRWRAVEGGPEERWPGAGEDKAWGSGHVAQSPDFSALIVAAGRVAQGAAARAAALDHDGAFPVEDIAALRANGLLAAPLPPRPGGRPRHTSRRCRTAAAGVSADRACQPAIGAALRGARQRHQADLSLWRVGRSRPWWQREALAGRLFGVWNTEVADGCDAGRGAGWRLAAGGQQDLRIGRRARAAAVDHRPDC